MKTFDGRQVVIHDKEFKTDDEHKLVLDELKKYFFDKAMRLFSDYGPLDLAYEVRDYGQDCENLLKQIDYEYEREYVDDQKVNFYIQRAVYLGMNPEVD